MPQHITSLSIAATAALLLFAAIRTAALTPEPPPSNSTPTAAPTTPPAVETPPTEPPPPAPVTELPPPVYQPPLAPPTPEPPAAADQPTYADDVVSATIHTSMGNITCKLFYDEAPNAVTSFVGLAQGTKPFRDPNTDEDVTRPFYDGVAFHRVIPNFVIQAGDPTGKGTYRPGFSFENEVSDRKHKPGTLAMANAGPGTNGSQFYIAEQAFPYLDGRYTIFGECENLDVVRAIARVPTAERNKPVEPVTIETISIHRSCWR